MSLLAAKVPAMNSTAPRRNGRPPATPPTARGRALLAAITAQNLTLAEAAKRAGLTFAALHGVIHNDPDRLTVRTVRTVCQRLGVPLRLVAPKLAEFVDALDQ